VYNSFSSLLYFHFLRLTLTLFPFPFPSSFPYPHSCAICPSLPCRTFQTSKANLINSDYSILSSLLCTGLAVLHLHSCCAYRFDAIFSFFFFPLQCQIHIISAPFCRPISFQLRVCIPPIPACLHARLEFVGYL
jgi:hypothetical protein